MMNNTPKKENAAFELFSGFGNSDFRMKIGGTVYEVSTHFDPEGSRCVLLRGLAGKSHNCGKCKGTVK